MTDPTPQAEKKTCPMCEFEGRPCPGGAHAYALYQDGIHSMEDYVRKCKPAEPSPASPAERVIEVAPQGEIPEVKRWTSQTSFDGLSHRMVEFEHGEYVRFCDYYALRKERDRAQKALREAMPILEHFARENPIWHDFTGRAQDPEGVHALLAALKPVSDRQPEGETR